MLNKDKKLLKHIAVHEAGHLLACSVFNKDLALDKSFVMKIDENGLNINGFKASGHVSLDLSKYKKQENFKKWLMINYLMGYRADLLINEDADEALFENDKQCWNECATEDNINSIEQKLVIFKQHTKIADDFIKKNKIFIEEVANMLIEKKSLIYEDLKNLLNNVRFTNEFPLFKIEE